MKKYEVSHINFENYKKNLVPAVVIGVGPAGLASLLYLVRMGMYAVGIGNAGGQLTGTGRVENYPGVPDIEGTELISSMQGQAKKFGASFMDQQVAKIDCSHWPYAIHLQDGAVLYTCSVIMATGSTPKTLGCLGEKEYWGKGVTTCAVCDAPLFANKRVVVVGGGDSACEEALQLTPYASEIYILVRSSRMRASSVMKKRVEQEKKISIWYDTQIEKIMGDGKKVTHVLLAKQGEQENLDVSGVFIAIGHTPNTALLKGEVEMDESGLIKCKSNTQKTSKAGIFAAGDVENTYRQAAVAAGNGVKAALDAYDFLREIGLTESLLKTQKSAFLDKETLAEGNKGEEKKIPFLDKEEKKEEASRYTHMEEIVGLSSLKHRVEMNNLCIVDLYMPPCGPCKKLKEVITKLLSQEKINIPFYSINIMKSSDVADAYGVNSVPMLLVFYKGKLYKSHLGYMAYNELRAWVFDLQKKLT